MNKLISVIIPCWNVEPYIERCIESVLKQTYENIEVIAIDDGSTDDTSSKLKSFIPDKRLKFISQTKSGVSAARNKGLELAVGEFTAFVDGDDWLEPRMYEQLYAAINENNADVAVCNYNLIYHDTVNKCYSPMQNISVDINEDVFSYYCKYCACKKPNNYIWSRLYKSDVIKRSSLKFCAFSHGEDALFNFMLLPHIKRVAFINEGLYNYYQHSSSNIYNIATKKNIAQMYADSFDTLAKYYETNGFEEFLSVLPMHAFTRIRSVFFYSRLAGLNDEAILENIRVGFYNREIYNYLTGKK